MYETVHKFRSATPRESTVRKAILPLLSKLEPGNISYLTVRDGYPDQQTKAIVTYTRSAACHASVKANKYNVREVWCPVYRNKKVKGEIAELFFEWLANNSMFSTICTLVEKGGTKYLRVDSSKGFTPMYSALITSRMFIEARDQGKFASKAAEATLHRGVDWPMIYLVSQMVLSRGNNGMCQASSPNAHHAAVDFSDLSNAGLRHWLNQGKVTRTENKKRVWKFCGLCDGIGNTSNLFRRVRARLLQELVKNPEAGPLNREAKPHTIDSVYRAVSLKIEEEVDNVD